MRYKIVIEYCGSMFCGWQQQKGLPSVQAAIMLALFNITGKNVDVYGAGRTDSGVHALGQVAHFDLDKLWDTYKLTNALNFHLKPNAIAILNTEIVDNDFHARFSAIKRHYIYRIINRHSPLTIDLNRAWLIYQEIDYLIMQQAGQELLGQHDFTTFRSSQCQAKSPIKTIDSLVVTRDNNEIIVSISARSFLHNQVRSIVGSLKMVGAGQWNLNKFILALEAKDRKACGPVAPPDGLYLVRVDY